MTATVGREVGAAGDEVARLYDRYASKLRRFCLGRLRCAEDADDAVQTVFLRAYTALRGGTAPVYEAAWLYKIAHNVCLSRLESGAARRRVEEPRDLDALQDVLAAPGERRDELVGLADALAAMPPNLRQAILLREWQGLSYAEIAEALDVSVSAVETLIFRARRHLAAALERGSAPARSAVTLLQLPWLLRRLRSLLVSGRGPELGVAKLSAVAVLATAGVGAGVATSVLGASQPPGTSTVTSPAAPQLGAAAAPARQPAAHVRRVAAPAQRPVAPGRRPAARGTVAPVVPLAPPVAATATSTATATTAAPGRPPAAAAAGVPPAPAPTSPPDTTAPPPPPLPTATTPATTAAALPTTTVPAIPPVTVTAPAAPVPTVSLPVPTVSGPVPTVSVAAPTLPVTTTSLPTVAVTVGVPPVTATTPVAPVPVTTPRLP